jgi:hypothetical protein
LWAISPFFLKDLHTATLNLLEQPFVNDGKFDSNRIEDFFNRGSSQLCIFNFIQSLMFLYAIYLQYFVESDFNIMTELILVASAWTICNYGNLMVWFFVQPDLSIRLTGDKSVTIGQGTWTDFIFYAIRSFVVILLSTFKNLIDTYNAEKQLILPPEQIKLESLDLLLHNREGIDHFYCFLDELNEQ